MTSKVQRIVGNEMQIGKETINSVASACGRGWLLKSQPDCLSGDLHSINQRYFLFKLELFFFQRSPPTNYIPSAALQKRLHGCDYMV